MRWLSLYGQFIEFSLSWDILGASPHAVKTVCETPPLGFEPICSFDINVEHGCYGEWRHHIAADWPGDYARLWCRQAQDGSLLHVNISATPWNNGYPQGLDFLAKLLALPHAEIKNISFGLNGDGYSAFVEELTQEHLHLLLTDIGVEMDQAIEAPWEHVVLDLAIATHSDRLFLQRL